MCNLKDLYNFVCSGIKYLFNLLEVTAAKKGSEENYSVAVKNACHGKNGNSTLHFSLLSNTDNSFHLHSTAENKISSNI